MIIEENAYDKEKTVMNNSEILGIGFALEQQGLSHSEIDDYFLEHYGVQGMKWGQRRAANKANVARLQEKGLSKRSAKATTRAQNLIDAQKMVAMGRQGKVSVLRQLNNRAISNMSLDFTTTFRHPLSAKKAAAFQLGKNKENQAKMLNGEKKVTAALLRWQNISIADLNFDT